MQEHSKVEALIPPLKDVVQTLGEIRDFLSQKTIEAEPKEITPAVPESTESPHDRCTDPDLQKILEKLTKTEDKLTGVVGQALDSMLITQKACLDAQKDLSKNQENLRTNTDVLLKNNTDAMNGNKISIYKICYTNIHVLINNLTDI